MSALLAFRPPPPCLTRKPPPPITCVSSDPENAAINRRNVCLGGGLYGATATFGNMAASAGPVQPPDLKKCKPANDPELAHPVKCCPPYGLSEPIDFTFNDEFDFEPLRVRKPAHKLSPWEVDRFRTAIRTMKEYDEGHPWNWMQQAQIHCAFCQDAYGQVGFPEVPLQVHASWLFLPWHRYYLYFWEKILGKLIDEPTFAIPYWQWDDPEGMEIPAMYKNVLSESNLQKNSLYNCNRNPDHVSGVLDLKYTINDGANDDKDPDDIIKSNLCKVYHLMEGNLKSPESFLGLPLLEGQARNGAGQLEQVHNTVHEWVGPPDSPFWDMGNFHTAAREPLFWAHHANVDRLWSIYRKKRNYKNEFRGNDWNNWIESSFVFYDENNNVVKCKVRDCLDNNKLGFDYQDSGEPPIWASWCRDDRKVSRLRSFSTGVGGKTSPVREFGDVPRELKETIRALVSRPKPIKKDKEAKPEIILIKGFKFDPRYHARFDVYIAKPVKKSEGSGSYVGSDLGEYIGAFTHIPHTHGNGGDVLNEFWLGIGLALEILNAKESEQLVVSLVPRNGSVTIAPFSIVTVPEDD